jgi:hypothetical protein
LVNANETHIDDLATFSGVTDVGVTYMRKAAVALLSLAGKSPRTTTSHHQYNYP